MSSISSAGSSGYPGRVDRRQGCCAVERRSVSEQASVPAPQHGCLPTGTSSEEAVMQSAPTTLPRTPDGGLTSGIDWASSDHAVAVVNTDGVQVDRFITEHKPGSAPRVPPGTVLRGTVADPGELRRCWTSSTRTGFPDRHQHCPTTAAPSGRPG